MSHTAAQNNPQEDAARRFLAQLREEILRHPGVGHSLLGRMSQDPRSRFDFKILASQPVSYTHLTLPTSDLV